MVKTVLVGVLLSAFSTAWGQQPVAVGKTDDAKNYHAADGTGLSKDSSDAELTRSLDQSFSNDPQFNNVQVTVKHHRVVLTGAVASKDAKRRAERLAQNTEGVRDVRDHLKVKDTATAETSAQ
jgi:osmotically-inducible protein OsmY